MHRIEIYINNNDSLELHFFQNSNDEYPTRTYKGSECYNFIKIISGYSIQNIKNGNECLVLEYNGLVVNLDNFGESIKKRGMSPLANSIKKYHETKKLRQVSKRKVKRKNKYIRTRIIAGALVLVVLGSVVYSGTKKKQNILDKGEETNQEFFYDDIEGYEDDFEVDNDFVDNVIIQEEIDEPIVTINYEDRSGEDKLRITDAYYSNLINQYASRYGLDPNLVLAIATQERGIHSSEKDRGGATGLMQIQNSVWENRNITAYNFDTNSYETLKITGDNIGELHVNIQIGCMYLQNCMEYMNYNIVAAVQCYNMGKGNMDNILKAYSMHTNKTIEEILNDKNDIGWMDFRNIINKGDQVYIENVFSWLGDEFELNIKKIDNSLEILKINNDLNVKKIC